MFLLYIYYVCVLARVASLSMKSIPKNCNNQSQQLTITITMYNRTESTIPKTHWHGCNCSNTPRTYPCVCATVCAALATWHNQIQPIKPKSNRI